MRRSRFRRGDGQSINRLIPSVLTLLALSAGLTAIRYALDENYERAVIAILVAAILDALDGRIARALQASSRFGAELDSLSDVVCFGVAPAIIVFLWSLHEAGGLGWALVLVYAVCCALRLARFNTSLDSLEPKPSWAKNYFVGVPAPAAAGLALLPLVLGHNIDLEFFANPVVTGVVLLGVAALMVSRFPTFAFKQVKVPGRYVVIVLIAAGVAIAFLISTPWVTLAVAGIVYLVSIPYASVTFRRRQRSSEKADPVEEVPDE